MGDFNVRKITSAEDRGLMYKSALNDIEAFEVMLREGHFEQDQMMIGAEQEMCVVEKNYDPAKTALEILDLITEKRYTNELGLFNLEANLDPHPLNSSCIRSMEKQLIELLDIGYDITSKRDEKIILTGILPTLKYRHLQFEYMTPIERYKTLSETLTHLRGSEFEVHMQGVDDLIMSLGTVLFEACNTSFQLHLQIDPDSFVDKHNWSQMIAGPVLSACVNSPLLFANELWAETRIALFKQSLDTRSPHKYLRRKVPRVYFGTNWIKESPAELWKNDLMRFPLILTSDQMPDAMAQLKDGEIPGLRAIQLHNGTTYTWNRMCYGGTKPKPHLRIECRYIPSGPSVQDEIANLALWVGLMNAEPPNGPQFWHSVDFRAVKGNFINAAKTGLNTVHNWFGRNYKAKNLLLEILLPMAESGLSSVGLNSEDIGQYLGIIESRVRKERTGAQWLIHSHRRYSTEYGSDLAQRIITEKMYQYQRENIPVHEWELDDHNQYIFPINDLKVEEFMSTDIFSIHEEDSIEFANKVLDWKDFHHLPVEDNEGDLIGLITDGILKRHASKGDDHSSYAKDIMIKNPIVVHAEDTIIQAQQVMKDNVIKGVPVVFENKLVGILTSHDF